MQPDMTAKKCQRCGARVESIQTDGVDLYLKGEKMPSELIRAVFPCPYCKTGVIEWKRVRLVPPTLLTESDCVLE